MASQTSQLQQILAEGLALFNAGRIGEAEAAFRAVLAGNARIADAHHLLGLAVLRAGRAQEAVAAIARSIEISPGEPSFRSNLAVALKALGRREEAIASLREAIRIAPGYVQAHVNLGNSLREAGELAEAAQAYRDALALAPGAPEILNNLGNVCRELGELDDAVTHYREALATAPGYVEAMSNLASAEVARGRLAEALDLLERAIALEPGHGAALVTLGGALLHLGRDADAEAAFRRGVSAAPRLAEAHSGLADALVRRGQVAGAIGAYEAALAIRPDFSAARSGLVFMRNYLGGDPHQVTAAARTYGEALSRPSLPRSHGNHPDPDRPLIIGLVSGDFRSHAVATFLRGIVGQIDQTQYRLHAYATSAHRDGVSDVLRTAFSSWCDAQQLSDAALAEQIALDGVDILVDLSGHTMFNRLPVFALKPAPVQMSWLGYSGTTGVAEIDYVLADRSVSPPGEDALLTEMPWRMPDAYLCWTPPETDIAVQPLPALANGYVTFGCFNNVSKLSDETVALWSRILAGVPASRLMLKAGPLGDAATAEATAARFAAHGVDADRLRLVGRIADSAGHLAAYGAVDIGLDPFPYNGTTTTAEALWMGVPVLTLRGDRFIAHVGESMLSAAGLAEWIGADGDDVVSRAAAFASDLPALATLRAGLRQQLVVSPLCDAPRFARNLESAWRGMWHAWCDARA